MAGRPRNRPQRVRFEDTVSEEDEDEWGMQDKREKPFRKDSSSQKGYRSPASDHPRNREHGRGYHRDGPNFEFSYIDSEEDSDSESEDSPHYGRGRRYQRRENDFQDGSEKERRQHSPDDRAFPRYPKDQRDRARQPDREENFPYRRDGYRVGPRSQPVDLRGRSMSPEYPRQQRGRGRGGRNPQERMREGKHQSLCTPRKDEDDDYYEFSDHDRKESVGYQRRPQSYRERRWRDYEDDRSYQKDDWNFDDVEFSESSESEDSVEERYHRQRRQHRGRTSPSLRKDPHGGSVTRESMIDILLKKEDLKVPLLHLHEQNKLSVSAVRQIVKQNSNVFQNVDDVIELRVSVRICSAHNGTKGCTDRQKCKDLHICSKYVYHKCTTQDCVMGHNWLTKHNTRILSSFKIQHLPRDSLEKLMQLSLSSSTGKITPHSISVCSKYNKSSCRNQFCHQLHVCYNTIKGHSKCPKEKCSLNHDLLSNDCCRILKTADIDVNESPRDVLVALLEINPSLKRNDTEENNSSSTSNLGQGKEKERETKQNPPSGESAAKGKNVKKKPYTTWSYHAKGDVIKPEICYNSVEGICPNQSAGCPKLHALEHYHWQVRDKENNWLNLQRPQVIALEVSYCDVNSDNADMPRVDPTIQGSWKFLLASLGRDTWKANFKNMTVLNSSKTISLLIRRLYTEHVNGKQMKPAMHVWYFLDKQQNWIEYGKVDSLNETNLVSSITSDDIEKQFLKDSSKAIEFQNTKFKYVLDPVLMTQTNRHTQIVRSVRRRPIPHLVGEEFSQKRERKLPPDWDKMNPEERLKRVPISSSSEEYQKVALLLGPNIPVGNITQLERVQNRFHWQAFQNKLEEMGSIYGDLAKANVQQLFHGTSHNIISNICSENFDPKMHGLSSGQAYGQGTYFARDADMSYRYCKADSNGLKYMFVAEVAVGSIALGNSSMNRPPINTLTGMPFDSTGDNNTNPSIIVKYDKAEYYPKYIVTLK